MNWILIIYLIIMRRHADRTPLFGAPRYPEHLPEAEPILPGHTLLRPAFGMLKSSVKFPHRDIGGAVYGNLENLGITYGKGNERVLYTNFRKRNDDMEDILLQALRNIKKSNNGKSDSSVIVIEIEPATEEKYVVESTKHNLISEDENSASEILDESTSIEEMMDGDFRRMKYGKKKNSKHRNRSNRYKESSSTSSESTESDSSDYERNPGNPYTLHKNKYKQNWLWNHFMDGDHVNINPYAPTFTNQGPSGADLFFGRKWWYFNQDDYKPMK